MTNWQPQSSHQLRQARATLLRDVREFFYLRDILEVETPALSQAGNTDPFIESIQSAISTTSILRYLHTSPEYPMKRLLAANSGDIYQICKVWRANESGSNHNPEFTLLEWYRVGFRYHQLMSEVSELFHSLIPSLTKTDQFHSYENLFLEKFGINPHIAKHDVLIRCVEENISGLNCQSLDQQALLDALLTHCIEPDFAENTLTFVVDYPVSQSALAQTRKARSALGIKPEKTSKKWGGVFENNTHPVAERFEVYLGSIELGNGYQEEVGYQRNKEILTQENKMRKEMNLEEVKQDKHFLAACKSGIPASAGIAIGLDRVLMSITNVDSIQDTLNFPWDSA